MIRELKPWDSLLTRIQECISVLFAGAPHSQARAKALLTFGFRTPVIPPINRTHLLCTFENVPVHRPVPVLTPPHKVVFIRIVYRYTLATFLQKKSLKNRAFRYFYKSGKKVWFARVNLADWTGEKRKKARLETGLPFRLPGKVQVRIIEKKSKKDTSIPLPLLKRWCCLGVCVIRVCQESFSST